MQFSSFPLKHAQTGFILHMLCLDQAITMSQNFHLGCKNFVRYLPMLFKMLFLLLYCIYMTMILRLWVFNSCYCFVKMSCIGKHISCLQTPAFIINERKFQQNCDEMLERCRSSGVSLRGQTKTHKTVEGGVLQTGGTKRKIVTSTLTEVRML